MKKKMRNACICALAVMMLSSGMAGCKSKNAETEGEKGTVKVSGVNEFPITEEKTTLSIFCSKPTGLENHDTNTFTNWYEEKTNVHINWSVSSGDAQQAFNLMIASGEYPDIILGMGLSREQVSSLAKQGIVVDISKEIDKYGYYTKRMFEKEPTAKEYVMFGDKIYGIPRVSATYASRYKLAMWVYRPWM